MGWFQIRAHTDFIIARWMGIYILSQLQDRPIWMGEQLCDLSLMIWSDSLWYKNRVPRHIHTWAYALIYEVYMMISGHLQGENTAQKLKKYKYIQKENMHTNLHLIPSHKLRQVIHKDFAKKKKCLRVCLKLKKEKKNGSPHWRYNM